MAQLTIYLPDDVARDVKLRAKRAKKSVSAYLVSLARAERATGRKRLPKDFLATYGSWEGEFPEIDDPPPERVPKW